MESERTRRPPTVPQPTPTDPNRTQGEHVLVVNVTVKAESAGVSGAGALPPWPVTATRRILFDLVDLTAAPDALGSTDSGVLNGAAPAAADRAADSVAMKYYCALNFNVGGVIKANRTVERVAEDGPLSAGAYQCARECNKMGAACSAFGVVGASCYLMSAVSRELGRWW